MLYVAPPFRVQSIFLEKQNYVRLTLRRLVAKIEVNLSRDRLLHVHLHISLARFLLKIYR